MSSLQRALANIAFITGANLIGRALNLVLHVALGRLFGSEGLGGYVTAIALSAYFIFLADFGISPRIVREGAAAPELQEEEFAKALAPKLALSAIALVLVALLGFVLPYETWVVQLCQVLSVAAIVRSIAYLPEMICRARERLDLEGAAHTIPVIIMVGTSLTLLHFGYPVSAIGWAVLGSSILHLVLALAFARRFIRIRIQMPPDWSLMRSALPYATSSLTVLAFAQIDILIISFIESADFVGRYAAVSRLILIAGTFSSLATSAVLPTATRIFSSGSQERFDHLINSALRMMLSIGFAVAIGTVGLAQFMMSALYGDAFANLYPLLQAGSVLLIFKFAVSVLSIALTSCGRQADRARAMLIGLAATIVFVATTVPLFGIAGAVGSMVASEFVLAICLGIFLRKHIQWKRLFRTLFYLSGASVAALAAYVQFAQSADLVTTLIATTAATLTYLALFFVSGEGIRAVRFVSSLRAPPTAES
jgi:O-antigen/teichoic acid export membrane protein